MQIQFLCGPLSDAIPHQHYGLRVMVWHLLMNHLYYNICPTKMIINVIWTAVGLNILDLLQKPSIMYTLLFTVYFSFQAK